MSWWARLFAWGSGLAVAAWLLGDAYRRGLAIVAMSIFSLGGQSVELQKIEVLAPSDLALFAALCLAGGKAPRRDRLRALTLGLPLLVVMDVLSVVLGVGFLMVQSVQGPAPPGIVRLVNGAMAMLPWMSAAALWLALVGFVELPIGRQGSKGAIAGGGPSKTPPARVPRAHG